MQHLHQTTPDLYQWLNHQPLEVIEVQTGTYLGEDDIERFEDDFNRH